MRRFPVVALAALVSACSLSPPEDSPRVAYREADSVQSLVVPPDLTRSRSSEALDIAEPGTTAGDGVLPDFDRIRMVRSGPLQWLEVHDADPEELWPRMGGFLRNEGLTIRTRRPAEGLIETSWARRLESIPRGGLGGFFQNLIGTAISDDIRDKYQIRLERIENNGGTRIFLTHWAAQEMNRNPDSADSPILGMARVEPEPAIAAEMRRRLLVYLGISRERAETVVADGEGVIYTTPVRLVVTEGGVAHVEIDESSYRRALGLVGEALRLAGTEVISTDESAGEIRVRWLPPEEVRGSGLFSDDRPREMMVRLTPGQEMIRVVAADADGTVRSGKVHVALLERMVEQMGGDTTSYRDVSDPEDDYVPQFERPQSP